MARNAASARSSASARTAPTYPRTPVGGVYIPGAKSIEGATGDIPKGTPNGWIEDEKYRWVAQMGTTNGVSEFDTAVTRTGTKTIKLSAPDTSATTNATLAPTNTAANLQKYAIKLKPSTAYVLSCYIKTTTAGANKVSLEIYRLNSAGAGGQDTETFVASGTNDWTLYQCSFTTGTTAIYAVIYINLYAGTVSDVWADVNSMTLIETGVSRGVVT